MAKIEERLARLEAEFNHRLMYAPNYMPIHDPNYFLGQSGSVATRNTDSRYSKTPLLSGKESLEKESPSKSYSPEYPLAQNKETSQQDLLQDESPRSKSSHSLEELRTMDEKQSETGKITRLSFNRIGL